jgi:hypothetical protein
MDRIIDGRTYPGSPKPKRVFVNETIRWKTVVRLIRSAVGCLPTWERQLFADMIEALAYAESRLLDEQTGRIPFETNQLTIPGILEDGTGTTTEPSE